MTQDYSYLYSQQQQRRSISMKKQLIVKVVDAKTNEVVKEIHSDKIMTVEAKKYAAWRYASFDQVTNRKWVIVLGTGSGTPSETDTQLFNPEPTTEKECEVLIKDNAVAFHVLYSAWEANGLTYQELGLFLEDTSMGRPCYDSNKTPTGACVMHEHGVFTPIVKNSNVSLDIYVAVTFI